MERRFELRLEELLKDAVLDPRIPEGMLDHLERFVKPFAVILESTEQQRHLWEYDFNSAVAAKPRRSDAEKPAVLVALLPERAG
ncbi:MAG: hypothetical protein ABSH20_22660 [Tepidisphaeraceae bacterium]